MNCNNFFDYISYINERNRQRNVERAEEALKVITTNYAILKRYYTVYILLKFTDPGHVSLSVLCK